MRLQYTIMGRFSSFFIASTIALISIASSGCGGGGSSSSPIPSTSPTPSGSISTYNPLQAGNTRTLIDTGSKATFTVTDGAPTTFNGNTATPVTWNYGAGSTNNFVSYESDTTQGLDVFGNDSLDASGQIILSQRTTNSPALIVPESVFAGSAQTVTYTNTGSFGHDTITEVLTPSTESVTTPAGTFTALKVTIAETDIFTPTSGSSTTTKSSSVSDFVAGIGQVQEKDYDSTGTLTDTVVLQSATVNGKSYP